MVQVILVACFLVLVIAGLRSRRTQRTRAAKKILFIAVGLVAVAAVLFPGVTQDVADLVGVGRGTDLVLYLAIVLVSYAALDIYLRFQDLNDQVTRLTRALALLEEGQDDLQRSQDSS
jgi:hypothetical protein